MSRVCKKCFICLIFSLVHRRYETSTCEICWNRHLSVGFIESIDKIKDYRITIHDLLLSYLMSFVGWTNISGRLLVFLWLLQKHGFSVGAVFCLPCVYQQLGWHCRLKNYSPKRSPAHCFFVMFIYLCVEYKLKKIFSSYFVDTQWKNKHESRKLLVTWRAVLTDNYRKYFTAHTKCKL